MGYDLDMDTLVKSEEVKYLVERIRGFLRECPFRISIQPYSDTDLIDIEVPKEWFDAIIDDMGLTVWPHEVDDWVVMSAFLDNDTTVTTSGPADQMRG